MKPPAVNDSTVDPAPANRSAWLEPGCHPVADGVFRIPLELPQDGLRAVNVYVLETDSGIALIDGGWHRPDTHAAMATALSSIGRRPEEITDVFVTHIHRDHYTFAVELRRRYGCAIHLGAGEAHGLSEIRRINCNVPEESLIQARRSGAHELADEVYRVTVDEPFDATDWEDPDTWLHAGPLPLAGRHVEAVDTPGHTKGHIVFHDHDTGLSFTGDHILPTITPSIGFELGTWDLPLAKFLASLEFVADDPTPRTIAPAHGNVGGSVRERARALLDHHGRRFDEILTVIGEEGGPLSGHRVAERLLWTRHDRPFSTLDTFNQLIAVCETMAHLDVLVTDGRLTAHTVDGVDLFRR